MIFTKKFGDKRYSPCSKTSYMLFWKYNDYLLLACNHYVTDVLHTFSHFYFLNNYINNQARIIYGFKLITLPTTM